MAIPLTPVGPRRRLEPVVAAVALSVVLVALALWKPWSGGPSGRAAELATPVASDQVARAQPASRFQPGLPLVAGLDVSYMGLADPHRTYGVAAAYMPRQVIVAAMARGDPAVIPVVDWVAYSPAFLSPPVLNTPGSVVVALAVTWPLGKAPGEVRLVDLGRRASVDGGSGHGRSAGRVALDNPLRPLLGPLGAQLNHGDHEPDAPWTLISGTFFLPGADLPSDPSVWLTAAWAPSSYAFVITAADGTVVQLPFGVGG